VGHAGRGTGGVDFNGNSEAGGANTPARSTRNGDSSGLYPSTLDVFAVAAASDALGINNSKTPDTLLGSGATSLAPALLFARGSPGVPGLSAATPGGNVAEQASLGGQSLVSTPLQPFAAVESPDARGAQRSTESSLHSRESAEATSLPSVTSPPPRSRELAQARVKMLALTGLESCALLLPKLVCIARIAASVKFAIASRRLMKAEVVGLLCKWATSRRLRMRYTKMLAVSFPRIMLRVGHVDTVCARAFAVGFMIRSVRVKNAAVVSAAPAIKSAGPKKAAVPEPTGPKLRPIHWEALTEAGIKGTIWDRGLPNAGAGEGVSTPKAADLLLPALVTRFAERAPASEKPRPQGTVAAEHGSTQQLSCMLAIEVRRRCADVETRTLATRLEPNCAGQA